MEAVPKLSELAVEGKVTNYQVIEFVVDRRPELERSADLRRF